ncbi:MAG: hypothetical protein KDA42_10580 [Planctomycetales bacterium]|nr:hypothetical protein [Planctomycetales bacterium]
MQGLRPASTRGQVDWLSAVSLPWRSLLASFGLALLWIAALLILARRIAGALTQSPPTSSLAVLACGLILVAIALKSLAVQWRLRFAAACGVVVLGVGVSVPTPNTWPIVMLWLAILASVALLVGDIKVALRLLPLPANRQDATSDRDISRLDTATQIEFGVKPHTDTFDASSNVLQAWTRVESEDDSEAVYATLRSELKAGQRTVVLHLAFCPPFAAAPEIEYEQIDGPDASLKPVTVLPYGARFEARLPHPATAGTVIAVEVVALGPAVRTSV